MDVSLATDWTETDLEPLASLIAAPDRAGERRFFDEAVTDAGPGLAPVFHTNFVVPATLPLVVERLEHHPHAAQAFVPLDVSRYVAVIAPDTGAGAPDLSLARAFILSGQYGILYRPGTWHLGATVLDRPGTFAVLMWRGRADDDVFAPTHNLRITMPDSQAAEGREVA